LKVNLIWSTPNGDKLVGYMARVSNASASIEDTTDRLIRYLIHHKHWSPFEMVNACVELELPRDIGRQLLRHRSFSFQEFSGRYAEYERLADLRECRLQDSTNRQNSLPVDDQKIAERWQSLVSIVRAVSWWAYRTALDIGVAKEVARVLLPEGLVPSKMYVNGTLRSWIHYWAVRTGPDTQKEHRDIALETRKIILAQYPEISKALDEISN
jgi:thymidylate synthase (FAD)